MKRTLSLCCLCTLILCIATLGACARPIGQRADSTPHVLTYLAVGFDEAAANTDVMLLVSLNTEEGTASAVQLPRDTYVRTGYAQNKINQIYAGARAAGKSPTEAIGELRETVEHVLGCPIDGAVGITLSTLGQTVDRLGGVRITLPEPISLDTGDEGEAPMTLTAGEHVLDGATACRLVRHRKGYASGDLGRMDAQKLFLCALLRTLRERVGLTELVSLCDMLRGELILDQSPLSLVATAINQYPTLARATLRLATLPGEAVTSETGLSYYAVNRAATAALLRAAFGIGEVSVDPDGQLLKAGDTAFENIYYDKGFSYRVYTEEDVGDIHIPRIP